MRLIAGMITAVLLAAVPVAAEPRELAHHEADTIVAGGRVFLLTDSVALSAVDDLADRLGDRTYTAMGFPGFHAWAAPAVLDDDPARIADTVIVALAKNDRVGRTAVDGYIADVMAVLVDTTQVIWVRPRQWVADMQIWNDALTAADRRWANLELADWPAVTRAHPQYLYADGIHLRPEGQAAMADLLDDHVRGRIDLPGRGVRARVAEVRSTPRGVRVHGAAQSSTAPAVPVRIVVDGRATERQAATGGRFDILVPRVADGRREVCVEVADPVADRWVGVECSRITVAHSPLADIRIIRNGDRVHARGWTFDPDRTDRQLRVRVMADDKRVGGPVADRPRHDVAAAYDIDPHHGFRFTVRVPVGSRRVCVWALDTPGNRNTRMGCIGTGVPTV